MLTAMAVDLKNGTYHFQLVCYQAEGLHQKAEGRHGKNRRFF